MYSQYVSAGLCSKQVLSLVEEVQEQTRCLSVSTVCQCAACDCCSYWVFCMVFCAMQVYAPTFPGYGRSEKQSLAYSQELWRDFLRDFVLEVVQCPVVVAGNSIGGFISASLAADYPSLVKGMRPTTAPQHYFSQNFAHSLQKTLNSIPQ